MREVLLISLEFMGSWADSDNSLVNLGVSHWKMEIHFAVGV